MDARVNKGYDNINDSLRATQCNALHYIAPHCNSLQRAATQEPTGMDALMNNDYDNINDSLTATHCNTLQHTATHCTTLQLTAPLCDTGTHRHGRTHEQRLRQHQRLTHCNTLQHTATHCNTLQRIAPHCISIYMSQLHTGEVTLRSDAHKYLLTRQIICSEQDASHKKEKKSKQRHNGDDTYCHNLNIC